MTGKLPPSALPAVSFIKASGSEDGHAGYSDPADEQAFVAREINALERTSAWPHTALVINYDDSHGWYDHVDPELVNPSLSPAENRTDTTLIRPASGQCGSSPQPFAPLGGQQGRCGFGPRVPMMVISPFASRNHVDHHLSDEASSINLVETTGACRPSTAPPTRCSRHVTGRPGCRSTSPDCSTSMVLATSA